MKNIFLIFALISISAFGQTQPFSYGGDFKGEVNFEISPTIPNATISGQAVNKSQLDAGDLISYQNGRAVYTTMSNHTIPSGTSQTDLDLNFAVDPTNFNDAIDYEITWRDIKGGNSAIEKLSNQNAECYIDYPSISILRLVCDAVDGFAMPTGTKLILYK